MLVEQREAEEVAFKAILDKQRAVPSWWPSAKGTMSEAHYGRIRNAEKVFLREKRLAEAGPFRAANESSPSLLKGEGR